MCVQLYRHGSVVSGFEIMNTTIIRAVLCVCREDLWYIFMDTIWCAADPCYVACCNGCCGRWRSYMLLVRLWVV